MISLQLTDTIDNCFHVKNPTDPVKSTCISKENIVRSRIKVLTRTCSGRV